MMRLKTGHAAWIIAAGFWASASLLSAGEAAAQTTAQEQPAAVGTATGVTATSDAPVRLHPKKSASKSRKAERQAKAKKPAKEETAKREAKADDLKPTQDDSMPPSVANANAQWANDAKPTDTYNMSAQAGTVLSQMGAQPEPHATAAPDDATHGTEVMASDQLNELDRAAEDKPPLTLAKATIDAPASPAPAATTVENNRPWEQTSLIGKVFIALGGLLTVASAARMFIA